MAVTKRARFEVLRRDGHRCRYCGAAAADGAKLTVDHVVPQALGGGDDPANLVAACSDCNSGKTSTNPDAATVAQVSDDALRWAAARRAAAEQMVADVTHRTAYRDGFLDAWNNWGSFVYKWLPDDWFVGVTRWQEQGLPLVALTEAVDIAMSAKVPPGRVFVYMCGIVKRRLAELDNAADEQVMPSEPAESSVDALVAEWNRGIVEGRADALWDLTQVVDEGYPKFVETVREFGPKNFPSVWVA